MADELLPIYTATGPPLPAGALISPTPVALGVALFAGNHFGIIYSAPSLEQALTNYLNEGEGGEEGQEGGEEGGGGGGGGGQAQLPVPPVSHLPTPPVSPPPPPPVQPVLPPPAVTFPPTENLSLSPPPASTPSTPTPSTPTPSTPTPTTTPTTTLSAATPSAATPSAATSSPPLPPSARAWRRRRNRRNTLRRGQAASSQMRSRTRPSEDSQPSGWNSTSAGNGMSFMSLLNQPQPHTPPFPLFLPFLDCYLNTVNMAF